MDGWTEELAVWLGSAPLSWVRGAGLALPIARLGRELTGGRLAGSGGGGSGMPFARWDRALAAGAIFEVAGCAAAVADLAVGVGSATRGAAEDRAVDVVLRAGIVASDVRRLALLQSDWRSVLRGAHEACVELATAVAVERVTAKRELLKADLEDRAARAAGEALVALLLAGEAA